MVKIPDDLYPNASNVEDVIDEYIELGFDAMQKYFSDKTSYQNYIESFQDHEDAEDFIEAGRSLYRIQKQTDQSVKIILFISLIEKLTTKAFSNFGSWLNNAGGKKLEQLLTKKTLPSDEVKEIVQKLVMEYNRHHGARNNFANFVETYVSDDAQFRLILLFRGWKKDTVYKYTSRLEYLPKVSTIQELREKKFYVTDALMPKCYDWKMCCVELGSCIPEEGCLIKEDKEKFRDTIRAVAKLIYDMRSEIVHAASDKCMIPERGDLAYAGSINLVNGKPIQIEMTFDELEKTFMDSLKNYFDSKLS